jgi:hypothetical protein
LTVNFFSSQTIEVGGIRSDTRVRDLGHQLLRQYYPGQSFPSLRDVSGLHGFTVIDQYWPGNDHERRRLSYDKTLEEEGIQDGDHLRIRCLHVAGGGIHPWGELAAFLAGAVASGVAGNAAYDLLKSTLSSVRNRWSGGRSLRHRLRKDEAVEAGRAAICLKFDIEEPRALELMNARAVTVKGDYRALEGFYPARFPWLAKTWHCVYRVEEDALPETMSILISSDSHDPENSIIYLLGASVSGR